MTLTEPTTMLTDYMLGIAGLVFGRALLRSNAADGKSFLLWPLGFVCGGVAAIVGGTFHGFAAYQKADVHKALWDATMLLIGASGAFMIAAALSGQFIRDATHTRWLLAGLVTSLAGVLIQKNRPFNPFEFQPQRSVSLSSNDRVLFPL